MDSFVSTMMMPVSPIIMVELANPLPTAQYTRSVTLCSWELYSSRLSIMAWLAIWPCLPVPISNAWPDAFVLPPM